jgi:hypothetical protein
MRLSVSAGARRRGLVDLVVEILPSAVVVVDTWITSSSPTRWLT